MHKTPEPLDKYIRMKFLMCDFYLSVNETSKTWNAAWEVVDLIGHLDMFYEFVHFQKYSNDEDWILSNREKAIKLFRKIAEKMIQHINEDSNNIDPILQEYSKKSIDWLEFNNRLLYIHPSERGKYFSEMMSHFKKSYPEFFNTSYHQLFETLDQLFKQAVHEMKSNFSISKDFFLNLIKSNGLNFCKRSALERMNIFRFSFKERHLIFSAHKRKEVNKSKVYLTPNLDRYLFYRDLYLNALKTWGRFIPLSHNQMLIQFYNQPRYWDNSHMFLENLDYTRLGFAYFQYAMEMGENTGLSRMSYRKALNCFSRSNIGLPQGLYEKLWTK